MLSWDRCLKDNCRNSENHDVGTCGKNNEKADFSHKEIDNIMRYLPGEFKRYKQQLGQIIYWRPRVPAGVGTIPYSIEIPVSAVADTLCLRGVRAWQQRYSMRDSFQLYRRLLLLRICVCFRWTVIRISLRSVSSCKVTTSCQSSYDYVDHRCFGVHSLCSTLGTWLRAPYTVVNNAWYLYSIAAVRWCCRRQILSEHQSDGCITTETESDRSDIYFISTVGSHCQLLELNITIGN